MEFVIVTGLSGAGKSRAVDALEDIGFYCVDNMPPKLLPKFAELCLQSKETLSRVAIVIDARGGELFDDPDRKPGRAQAPGRGLYPAVSGMRRPGAGPAV